MSNINILELMDLSKFVEEVGIDAKTLVIDSGMSADQTTEIIYIGIQEPDNVAGEPFMLAAVYGKPLSQKAEYNPNDVAEAMVSVFEALPDAVDVMTISFEESKRHKQKLNALKYVVRASYTNTLNTLQTEEERVNFRRLWSATLQMLDINMDNYIAPAALEVHSEKESLDE